MPPAAAARLLTMRLETEQDVFTVRQRGRDVAAALGLDAQDQVRVATALSEVGREVLLAGGASVTFDVTTEPRTTLVVALETAGPLAVPGATGGSEGVLAASRLLDAVTTQTLRNGVRLLLSKWLRQAALPSPTELGELQARLAGSGAVTAMDELRTQNSEMLAALEELQRRQGELQVQQESLLRLNGELEETNRGVLAMYSQLSDELEETNRGVVALYADLDEKSSQLKDANEAKTRFLANVSHELRAPVNSILGLAQLLGTNAAEPLTSEQARQVEFIRTNAADLLGLVNELLDLAKAESGRLEPVLTEVGLPEVFANLRGSLRPLAAGTDVELIVAEPFGQPVHTDEGMLGHILRNLLTNALKFTERGTVELSAALSESGHHAVLTVRDTGIGIPAAEQERIFEEFYQVRSPLQISRKGTGLGLPYARRLTELLGGRLSLSSAPGEGSTFTVSLPLRWQQAPSRDEAGDGHDDGPPITVGSALVVDDDESFRHVLRGMLQGVAGRVIEATDGADALRLLERGLPDVIFVDLHMPNVDGPELLDALARDPRTRELPKIVVTNADLQNVTAALPGAAGGVVSKSGLTRDQVLASLAGLFATAEDAGQASA